MYLHLHEMPETRMNVSLSFSQEQLSLIGR